MKKILFISLFFLHYSFTNAQTYKALPDSNAIWIMEEYSGFQPQVVPNWYYAYYTNADTIINTKKYTKLFATYMQHSLPLSLPDNSCYLGAYRSDTTRKVYFIFSDSTNEYRLFDFSKNIGDTINNIPRTQGSCNSMMGLYNGTVDSIKYITMGARTFKRISFVTNNFERGVWMEGVGSPKGGFFPLGFGQAGLFCMSHNDTSYYHGELGVSYAYVYGYDYTAGYCDTIIVTSINDNRGPSNEIKIYPTLFSNNLTIDFPPSTPNLLQINIINLLGQVCKSVERDSSLKINIDMSSISNGFYFLVVSDGKKIIKIQKTIKQ